MAHIVTCRICKCKFDTDKEDTILVGQKSYYHKSCYENWVKGRNNAKTNGDEDFWYESVIDYLYRDVKMSIDFAKLKSQWANFRKPDKKMTAKGIYFAIKYFYEVMNGDKEKAQGGIGIIQYIYNDAAQYWINLENKKAGTIEAIIEQIRTRENRPVQVITHHSIKKKKTKFSLDDI